MGRDEGRRKREQLGRRDWVEMGLRRLVAKGVEGVRVEGLARDLGVSKGSFYWHFDDRADLLEAMLASWELGAGEWMSGEIGVGATPAERWGRAVALASTPRYGKLDAAVFAWASRSWDAAERVAAVERKRAEYIGRVLEDIGFSRTAAGEWATVLLLLYGGWVDWTARDGGVTRGNRDLGRILSQVVRAASVLESESPGGL